LSLSSSLHFPIFFFLVYHIVNRDVWHLLAQAMASDFTTAWQVSQREIG
jgi:hypothetical protein